MIDEYWLMIDDWWLMIDDWWQELLHVKNYCDYCQLMTRIVVCEKLLWLLMNIYNYWMVIDGWWLMTRIIVCVKLLWMNIDDWW